MIRFRAFDKRMTLFNVVFYIQTIKMGAQTRGVAQLVARLVRDQEVPGSNPGAPSLRTNKRPDISKIHG
jgi:hypothetical protein